MKATPETLKPADERELLLVRTLNAPRELVFEVWTDPMHLLNWFGPRGYTTAIDDYELKPGGVWRFTMEGPDGTAYPNRVTFETIERPALLKYRHDTGQDDDPSAFTVTVSFDEDGPRTRLAMRMRFDTAEQKQEVESWGAVAGGHSTLDRLEEWLSNEQLLRSSGDPDMFVVSRLLDAPIEQVFNAWNDIEALAQWWGPKGCRTEIIQHRMEQDGLLHYRIVMPDGFEMLGFFVFKQVEPPTRIVYTSGFADENAQPVRAPFADDWPLVWFNEITLTEQDGRTLLSLRSRPLDATEAERERFRAGHPSMRMGFGGTLDQLAAFLKG